MQSRRTFLFGAAGAAGLAQAPPARSADLKKYVRFEAGGRVAYGLLEGDTIRELRGDPILGGAAAAGPRHRLSAVRLLPPCEPSKVLAVGLNYRSHLGARPAPKNPEIFFKVPSSLLPQGGQIILPGGTNDVHYEGELVVVMGRKAKKVSAAEARACVFGVTCGNDVSARDWQKGDLQWWRAKSSDTFGVLGPAIVTGLDYGNLQLQTRLNGQVKQSQSTSDLLFDVPAIISFISQAVTLLPGDVIYTGTPGATSAMKPGDVVEVDIEGIGVLRNTIAT